MKVLWICGLPRWVQKEVLGGEDYGAYADWSWILGHLPPPDDVELHIACRTTHHTSAKEFSYQCARFHLVPVKARARLFCLYQFDWLYFRSLVSRLKPDVIHGWGTEDAYAWTALKLSPHRHVIEVQGNINAYRRRVRMPWLTRLAALSERIVLARAQCVVVENEYSLVSAMPMIRTPRVHVVEHPIRLDFLTAHPSSGEARQILFLGGVEERKGVWDALAAFERSAPEDWKLVIVGNGRHDAVRKLQQLIGEKRWEGRVLHYPQLNAAQIVSQMQVASIFLLPTRIDTGPTALKEALAMGLWPVCYDNSGPGHYIRRFEYGDVAEDLNPRALAEVLGRAIAAQKWKQAANRIKIQTRIRPHFDRSLIWKSLVKVYREAGTGAD